MFVHKYEDIITMEKLLFAWKEFLKEKKDKKDIIYFQLNFSENITDLYQSLAKRTYRHGKYYSFNVFDPKPRRIHKANVRDRVLHRLIYRELYNYFDNRFIYDSYSCRKNKGVHKAMDRIGYFAGKVSKNHSRTCYVLKCDIKKFFDNVNHDILIRILKRHIEDSDIIWLIERVIFSFHSGGADKGLPLGNITSHLLANVYLHEFDMFIKQEVLVKYYIRYGDDFVILSEDKDYLISLLPAIRDFLFATLGLAVHKKKLSVRTYGSGIDFLGWLHFPHYRQIRTTTERRIIRKLKHYPRRETIISYRGLLNHGNTYKLRKRLGLVDYIL